MKKALICFTVVGIVWMGGMSASRAASVAMSLLLTGTPPKAQATAGIDFKTPIQVGSDGVDLTVMVGAGLDPSKIGLTTTVGNIPPPTLSPTQAVFHLTPFGAEATLEVQYNNQDVQAIAVAAPRDPNAGSGGNQGAPAGATTIKDLLKTACANVPVLLSSAPNVVNLIVSANGNVLSTDSPDGAITETDTVVVQVLADSSLVPYIGVVRTSSLRLGGGINILGSDVSIPGGFIKKGAKQAAPACGVAKAILAGFAPGKGTIEISAQTGADKVTLGTIELAVHALYTGMFSLGGAWGSVNDPSFAVVSNGTTGANGTPNTVVTSTETGSHRFFYTLFYTPFVWGGRDIQRSIPFWQHVNPTVGLALNDPLNNAFVGLSVDLFNSIVFTAGGMVSHVAELDPSSNLKPGAMFTGMSGDLPISHSWKTGHFFAVSIDLRAAVQLIQIVLGTNKS
jgi:hypothetical protein